ncbi:MAG: sigma-70 family RNA polymerase sigma factor [Planctomycetes bacterium]|nr:sigma-70 family RNA polymerase sigma factor [Planctomycetota bacterium]MCB9872249.1 sigma-70 family RNA polymerase sigma factor [Planctomycetota bacterium]
MSKRTATRDPAPAEHRSVWRFLRFLGAPADLADDLTQEVFLRLCEQPLADQGDAARLAWLRRTALNLFRSAGRRMRRELRAIEPTQLDEVWARITVSDPTGDRHAEALRGCMQRLEGRTREALALRYGEGLGREAIAERLALSPEGVKSLLRRALERLRNCIRIRLESDR